MNGYRGVIPGVFTLGNLFCGFASILTSIRGNNPTEAAWMIVFAAFFDFLDGLIARLSKSASRFGVELDSLCDIVSFGVAPAAMLYSFKMVELGNWGWILGFVFIAAGAFRLARYNLTARIESKSSFIGLPLPAAALGLASFVIFCDHLWGSIKLDRILYMMVIAYSALMVSTIEFESMPSFDISVRRNRIKIMLLVGISLMLLIKTKLLLFPLLVLYAISGPIRLVVGLANSDVRRELLKPRNIFSRDANKRGKN